MAATSVEILLYNHDGDSHRDSTSDTEPRYPKNQYVIAHRTLSHQPSYTQYHLSAVRWSANSRRVSIECLSSERGSGERSDGSRVREWYLSTVMKHLDGAVSIRMGTTVMPSDTYTAISNLNLDRSVRVSERRRNSYYSSMRGARKASALRDIIINRRDIIVRSDVVRVPDVARRVLIWGLDTVYQRCRKTPDRNLDNNMKGWILELSVAAHALDHGYYFDWPGWFGYDVWLRLRRKIPDLIIYTVDGAIFIECKNWLFLRDRTKYINHRDLKNIPSNDLVVITEAPPSLRELPIEIVEVGYPSSQRIEDIALWMLSTTADTLPSKLPTAINNIVAGRQRGAQ